MSVESVWDMTPRWLAGQIKAYAREFHSQSERLNYSVSGMNMSLEANQREEFWYHAEATLSILGRIASLIWPTSSNASAVERGRVLRMWFALPEDAYLTSRAARNALEHFDERVDKWVKTSENKNIVTGIMPDKSHVPQGYDVIRAFYTEDSVLQVFAGELKLSRALGEVEEMKRRIPNEAAFRGGWEPTHDARTTWSWGTAPGP